MSRADEILRESYVEHGAQAKIENILAERCARTEEAFAGTNARMLADAEKIIRLEDSLASSRAACGSLTSQLDVTVRERDEARALSQAERAVIEAVSEQRCDGSGHTTMMNFDQEGNELGPSDCDCTGCLACCPTIRAWAALLDARRAKP